jgi:hypothetical protein
MISAAAYQLAHRTYAGCRPRRRTCRSNPSANSTFDGPPFRQIRIPIGTFHFPAVHNHKTTCIPHTGLPTLLDHTQLTASATRVKRSQLVSSITR